MTIDLVLASGSLSRRRSLENAGLRIEIIKPNVDEPAYKAQMRARSDPLSEQAMYLAELKAVKVSHKTDRLVLAGDQMLNLNGKGLDKPPDLKVAKQHLQQLSGQTHILETAIVIAHNGEVIWRHLSRPRLTVRSLSDAFIEHYIEACGDALCQTVGAYMLEGRGIQLFEKIEGDFFAILGLPLLPLLDYLRTRGVIAG